MRVRLLKLKRVQRGVVRRNRVLTGFSERCGAAPASAATHSLVTRRVATEDIVYRTRFLVSHRSHLRIISLSLPQWRARALMVRPWPWRRRDADRTCTTSRSMCLRRLGRAWTRRKPSGSLTPLLSALSLGAKSTLCSSSGRRCWTSSDSSKDAYQVSSTSSWTKKTCARRTTTHAMRQLHRCEAPAARRRACLRRARGQLSSRRRWPHGQRRAIGCTNYEQTLILILELHGSGYLRVLPLWVQIKTRPVVDDPRAPFGSSLLPTRAHGQGRRSPMTVSWTRP